MTDLIHVSHSELDTLKQCPFKHQLMFIEGWEGGGVSRGLAIGGLFHSVLESHYRWLHANQQTAYRPFHVQPGEVAESEVVALPMWPQVEPWLYTPHGEQGEYQATVEWMYRGYVHRYGTDPQWAILGVEERHELWIPTPLGNHSKFILRGKLDLRVQDLEIDQTLLVDHKSSRYLIDPNNLDLYDQFGLYFALLKANGFDVFASYHNNARTQQNKQRTELLDERYHRHLMWREPDELHTILREAYETFYRAYRGEYWSKDGDAPRWPDPDRCGWKCPYTQACISGRKGTTPTREMLQDLQFVQDPDGRWNYYQRGEPSEVPF